jgi:tRNA (guanine-N7-)-methyltransferase
VLYELASVIHRLDLADLFAEPHSLEVELGSGDGSFLVECAARFPERNFIGVERLLGRVRKLERKARRAGLTNLRVIRIETSYFLQYLLPPHSASALHLYFPDPWPKRKHRRHRLVGEMFPHLAHGALTTAGRVFLRTDDPDYFKQMLQVFGASPLFKPIQTPEPLAAVLTDFERDFLARGTPTLRAGFEAVG